MGKEETAELNEQELVFISPDQIDAVLFDMDGVVTRTAAVHFSAWKKTFDAFLKQGDEPKNQPFTQQDYLSYVDGKPREDGVRSFLEARGIELPEGSPTEKPGFESISSIAAMKDEEFLRLIRTNGVEPYETTVALIRALRAAGISIALVTASKNGAEILQVTHLKHLFDATVDGVDAEKLKLKGKPAPDVFLEAAKRLSVSADRAVVVEDAEAGVEAGHNGRFGLVIGVARQHNRAALKKHGADAVVLDMSEVTVATSSGQQSPGIAVPTSSGKQSPGIAVPTSSGKQSPGIAVPTSSGQQSPGMAVPTSSGQQSPGIAFSALSGKQSPGMALADMDVTEANWIISYDEFIPEQEGRRESLCALGNGKFCTRGAGSESQADTFHYPGTYVAGGYDAIRQEAKGQRFENEELVNMPNWLCLSFLIEDGDWFDIGQVEILNYSQRLNLREGVLYRDVTFRDVAGRETKLSERRFVHMRYSHLAGIELVLSALNWSGNLIIRTALDGTIVNSGDPIDPKFRAEKHLQALDRSAQGDRLFLKVRTLESELVVAEAARTLVFVEGRPIHSGRTNIVEQEYAAQDILMSVAEGQSVSVQKTVALYTSRDRGIYEAGVAAKEAISDAVDFEVLISQHIQAWRSLWSQFDLFVETTEEYSKFIPSLLLHLNSFHVLQTASPHTVDLDTGVPAKGWTGEGYQGHVFWDDLFVFPFVNLRMPNISAALLKYRYRRLPEARKIAASHGASGACFPWQSASNGCERTPAYDWLFVEGKWTRDYTNLEIHVNGAIAYNVWQYYQVTLDEDFMHSYGCEILLEIARFFATVAKYNAKRERYEITGVIGPDEFHSGYPNSKIPGVNNNAYTNIMAVWSLSRALELIERLPADHRAHICARLNITDYELALWDDVSRKMFVPIIGDGVIEQFEGYDQLEEFPGRSDDGIDHEALQRAFIENDAVLNQYKITKQADVLMLHYLFSPAEMQELLERLGYSYQAASVAANCKYYIPRTANDSTLSRVAHVWALSRIDRLVAAKLIPFCRSTNCDKERDVSEHLFYEALGSDYFDVAARGTARTGVHMGAMAGTVDIVQRCFTGIVTSNDVLSIDPILPKPLQRLSFILHYRGHVITFDIDSEKVRVAVGHSSEKPIKIGYQKQIYDFKAGDTKIINLRPSRYAIATIDSASAA